MAKLACGMAHKHRPLGAAKGSSPNAPWPCTITGGGLLGRKGRYYWPSHTGPDPLALGNTCYGGQVEVKLTGEIEKKKDLIQCPQFQTPLQQTFRREYSSKHLSNYS